MEETNKQDKSVNDFEMGDPQENSSEPKINRYTQDIKAPESTENKIEENKVDPSSSAPPETPKNSAPEQAKTPDGQPSFPPEKTVSLPEQEQTATNQFSQRQATPAQPTPVQEIEHKLNAGNKVPTQKVVNPAARKKAIMGCMGGAVGFILILLILSFIFIGVTKPDSPSPIASLFGINQATFINSLITFVHIIFILMALTAFTFTMVGLFKASMAKKDDKITKKKGLNMSIVSGVSLIILLIVWAFVYIYMDAKRVPLPDQIVHPIVTEPAETLQLVAPIEVKFDASNVPINKNRYNIVAYNWDFDDGNTGTGQITSHVFNDIGVYTVKLEVRVRDTETGELMTGGEYSTVVSIASQTINATFTATPQSGEAPLEVEFDASASVHPTGIIDRYLWDFNGNGIFDDAEGVLVSHTFTRPGIQTVSLQIVSTTGETAITTKDIEVLLGEDPTAVISVLGNPEVFITGTAYTFRGESSSSPNGKITSYKWNFGDAGSIQNTMTATHVFNSPGTYEVTLTVTDEAKKEAEEKRAITVRAPMGTPIAKISTNPQYSQSTRKLEGPAPLQVSFDASQSTDPDNNIVDYRWNFGDGSEEASGVTTTHTFTDKGTYTVKLSVIDADNNGGEATIIVDVAAQGIVPALSADRIEGTVPLTVNFNAGGSTYTDGQITSYRWDFGDGSQTILGSATISYRYTNVGEYTATVTVGGADGKTAQKSIQITVRSVSLNACFESTLGTTGRAPFATSFDPTCSTGTVSRYYWDFGDGGSSTSIKPTHTFTKAGTYKVELEISDTNNTISKFSKNIVVTD
jgi:PKD repeat protein